MHTYNQAYRSTLKPTGLEQPVLSSPQNTATPRLIPKPVVNRWQTLLARFEPTSLAQMDDVALLNRTDTKFMLNETQLYHALTALRPQYRVLDIAGVRLNHYQTLYFDTADFALYRRHHTGGRDRYKVRSREYLDSHLSFLEIKHKVAKQRTVKNRMQTPALVTRLNAETDDFMATNFPLDPHTLEPKLWNDFYRITLVSRQRPERLTLDLHLSFDTDTQSTTLPGVVIAEVKQASLDRGSEFMQQMRLMRVHPAGFSKYCVGVSLLYPAVKHNRFKPKLQLLNKLIKGTNYVDRTH